jgi:hypothetical protein
MPRGSEALRTANSTTPRVLRRIEGGVVRSPARRSLAGDPTVARSAAHPRRHLGMTIHIAE